MITRSPVADAKSIKNDIELNGFRQCHIRDGAALVGHYFFLLKVKRNLKYQLPSRLGTLHGWKTNLRKAQPFLRVKLQAS